MRLEFSGDRAMSRRGAQRRQLSRHDARALRRRAYALSQTAAKRIYLDQLAALVEIFEAQGLDAALSYLPNEGAEACPKQS